MVAGANTPGPEICRPVLPAIAVPAFLHLARRGDRPGPSARRLALHPDVGADSGLAADLDPAVLARVARVGGQEGRRHAEAAEHPGAVRPAVSADDDRHHADVRLQLRCGLWGDPANDRRSSPALPRSRRPPHGQSPPEQKKIAQQFAAKVGTIQEIGGLVGRVLLAFLAVRIVSRRKLLRLFQWPDLIIAPVMFCAVRHRESAGDAGGNLRRRPVDGGPIQLLGELSSPGLPNPFARDGRRVCRQYRRPDDRHLDGLCGQQTGRWLGGPTLDAAARWPPLRPNMAYAAGDRWPPACC